MEAMGKNEDDEGRMLPVSALSRLTAAVGQHTTHATLTPLRHHMRCRTQNNVTLARCQPKDWSLDSPPCLSHNQSRKGNNPASFLCRPLPFPNS
mmetsp:Transcript_23428/g.50945  ORF Transcript_23428/g.50945 Transcript_23428/m.50945 type:complete len:94 (-) Transcript_23428:509-790(-)